MQINIAPQTGQGMNRAEQRRNKKEAAKAEAEAAKMREHSGRQRAALRADLGHDPTPAHVANVIDGMVRTALLPADPWAAQANAARAYDGTAADATDKTLNLYGAACAQALTNGAAERALEGAIRLGCFEPGDVLELRVVTPAASYCGRPGEPAERAGLLGFITRHYGRRDIYVGINPRVAALAGTGLPGRTETTAGRRVVPLDFDRAPDVDPDWTRTLDAICEAFPRTRIVRTRPGGFHVWVPSNPMFGADANAVTGTIKQAQARLGADDKIADLPHILRVPFAPYVPTKGKRDKGRTLCLVDLIERGADEADVKAKAAAKAAEIGLGADVADVDAALPSIGAVCAGLERIANELDLPGKPGASTSGTGTGAVSVSGTGGGRPQGDFLAPYGELLCDLLAAMPNRSDLDRDGAVKICHGIRAASWGTPWEADARGWWLDWAGKWQDEDGNPLGDPAEDARQWDTMRPPFKRGWWHLLNVDLVGLAPPEVVERFRERDAEHKRATLVADPPDGEVIEGMNAAQARDRAKQEARDAALAALLDRFAWCSGQGKWFDRDAGALLDDKQLERSRDVLRVIPAGGARAKSAPVILLNDQRCLHLHNTTVAPGKAERIVTLPDAQGTPRKWGNLWHPGPVRRQPGAPAAWLDLLAFVIPDADYRGWLVRWMAYMVQHRGKRLLTIPILHGGQGIGKDLLLTCFFGVLGDHNVRNVKAEALTKDFNEWAEGDLLYLGEVKFDAAGAAYNTLKDAVSTEDQWITVNPKHVRPYPIRAAFSAIGTTNHVDALRGIEADDRRIMPYMSPALRTDAPAGFFARIAPLMNDLDEQGRLLGYLLDADLTGFGPTTPAPDTSGSKATMSAAALTGLARWTYDECQPGGHFADEYALAVRAIAMRAAANPSAPKVSNPSVEIAKGLRHAGLKPYSGNGGDDAKGAKRVKVGTVATSLWSGPRLHREAREADGLRGEAEALARFQALDPAGAKAMLEADTGAEMGLPATA